MPPMPGSRPGGRGPSRPRRTNAERTAETRARVLDAAVACLTELGAAHTTTLVVAERAGVSRGALLHHFPSRAELHAAAVRHLVGQHAEQVRMLLSTVPEGSERLAAAIAVLWQVTSGPAYAGWIELQVASRTDDELRPLVAELRDELSATIQALWAELFPVAPDAADAAYRALPTLFFRLLDGLALAAFTGSAAAEQETAEVLALVQASAAALPLLADLISRGPIAASPDAGADPSSDDRVVDLTSRRSS